MHFFLLVHSTAAVNAPWAAGLLCDKAAVLIKTIQESLFNSKS